MSGCWKMGLIRGVLPVRHNKVYVTQTRRRERRRGCDRAPSGRLLPSALDPHDPRVQMAKALYQDRAHEVGDICQTLHISRSTLYRYPAVPEG